MAKKVTKKKSVNKKPLYREDLTEIELFQIGLELESFAKELADLADVVTLHVEPTIPTRNTHHAGAYFDIKKSELVSARDLYTSPKLRKMVENRFKKYLILWTGNHTSFSLWIPKDKKNRGKLL